MRIYSGLCLLVVVACGNNPAPRIIAGGGIGDGAIDGTLNVYVIDNDTREPLVDAIVKIGSTQQLTDDTGLVIFSDVSGAQTIAVKANGYRGTVWQGANGANVTIPVTALDPQPLQANIMGGIAKWDTIVAPPSVARFGAALVGYSRNDHLGDAANNIQSPHEICADSGGNCAWQVLTRTGTVTLTAAIFNLDTNSTDTPDDDTYTVVGWATAPSFQVDANVAQNDKTLTVLDSSQLQSLTIDYGSPPVSLTEHTASIGVELGNDEVMELPLVDGAALPTLWPAPSAYAPNATYRLTAIAKTADGMGPQSTVIRRGLVTDTLAASNWLAPPANVAATRSSASFDAVPGAKLHSVQWSDSTGVLLEVTVFDGSRSVTVPDLVALTTSNALSAKVQGTAADFDVNNFSFDADREKILGFATQPADVP